MRKIKQPNNHYILVTIEQEEKPHDHVIEEQPPEDAEVARVDQRALRRRRRAAALVAQPVEGDAAGQLVGKQAGWPADRPGGRPFWCPLKGASRCLLMEAFLVVLILAFLRFNVDLTLCFKI